jgi:hypothetical protein
VSEISSAARQHAAADRRGHVDWAQLRVLLTLTLGQAYRRGVSSLTGAMHHPLRQLVLSFGFLGVFSCINLGKVPDAATFYSLVFAGAFALVLAGISPDAADARQRHADVLGSRPISGATAHGLRFVSFVFMGVLLSVPLALPGLVGAWLYFHVPLHLALLQLVMLLVQAAVAGMLWMQFFALAVRWISIEALRRASQVMTVGLLLVISFGSSGLVSPLLSKTRILGMPAQAAGRALLDALPSTSFATFFLADTGSMANAHRLGVLALVVLTLVLPWIGNLERRNQRLVDAIQISVERVSARPVHVHASLRVKLLRATSWLLAAPSAAVAETVLVHAERDDFTRVRSIAQGAMAIVFFLIGIGVHRPGLALFPLTYVSFAALVESLDGVRRSPQWAAGWIFFTCPLKPRHMVTGMQVAIALRSLMLPAALTIGLLFWWAPTSAAMVATVAYLVGLRLASAACMALRPGMPLATGERVFPEVAGLGLAVALGVASSASLTMMYLAVVRFGTLGLLMSMGGVVILVIATVATERAAASRLCSLEHAA